MLEEHPDLTTCGFGVTWNPRREDLATRDRRFEAGRRALLTAHRQFALALVWLVTRAPRVTPNTRENSYSMKHLAERDTDPHGYVSNGALITAALFLGLLCRVEKNCCASIAVSTALFGERERARAEKEARRAERDRKREERRRRRCFLPPLPDAVRDAMGGAE